MTLLLQLTHILSEDDGLTALSATCTLHDLLIYVDGGKLLLLLHDDLLDGEGEYVKVLTYEFGELVILVGALQTPQRKRVVVVGVDHGLH